MGEIVGDHAPPHPAAHPRVALVKVVAELADEMLYEVSVPSDMPLQLHVASRELQLGDAAGRVLQDNAARQSDTIAYRKYASHSLNPGIRFFEMARRMVVDAWVTSPEGTKILGCKGNVGRQKFEVPVEPLNYALARSPFKQG